MTSKLAKPNDVVFFSDFEKGGEGLFHERCDITSHIHKYRVHKMEFLLDVEFVVHDTQIVTENVGIPMKVHILKNELKFLWSKGRLTW